MLNTAGSAAVAARKERRSGCWAGASEVRTSSVMVGLLGGDRGRRWGGCLEGGRPNEGGGGKTLVVLPVTRHHQRGLRFRRRIQRGRPCRVSLAAGDVNRGTTPARSPQTARDPPAPRPRGVPCPRVLPAPRRPLSG